jgi:hypothetical protein
MSNLVKSLWLNMSKADWIEYLQLPLYKTKSQKLIELLEKEIITPTEIAQSFIRNMERKEMKRSDLQCL